MKMEVEGRLEQDTLVITVSGRIDSSNAGDFQEKTEELLASMPVKTLTLDLMNLEYISSAGLRVILLLKKKCQKLRIINVNEEVYNIFDITGINDVITMDKPLKNSTAPLVEVNSLNDTAWDFEYKPAVEMFARQVENDPEKMAVISSQLSYTYGELDEVSNRIANMLVMYNIRPDDTVMILLPRSVMVYAVNLGILKAGAAFVIANLSYPDDRISYMYKDAGCKYLITTHRVVFDRLDLVIDIGQRPLFLEHLIIGPWYDKPNVRIDEKDLAYCIYTSGSTGRPKGVMIENGNLTNFLHHNPKNHETMGIVEKGNVLLAIAPMTFDVSVMEEFIPFTSGMTVAMATEEEIMNPLMMRDFILKNKVDAMCVTPSYLNTLLSLPQLNDAIAQIRVFDMGAEAFPGALYDKIRAVNPDAYIMNGYGPTEATISCTMKVLDSRENITIGIPNSNVFCYIVDDQLNEVPKGEIGELLVCGMGVGRGYKNLPEKTQEVFVEFRGMKAYRTGDLARITQDEEIEYHGRKDSQIKLHGLRIELGEIEENIQKFSKIDICAVVPVENRYLCLYYKAAEPVTREEVREYAKGHLAHYMVPDLYEEVPEMPLTANKKIDRKALPKPEIPKIELKAPETPMQERILEIVKPIFQEVQIGADSDFHDLGMSSLDVIMILGALGEEYQVALDVNDISGNASVIKLEKMILTKPKLKKREKKDRYPTLDVQGLDYINWCNDNDPSHTLPIMVKLDPSVDTPRLVKALKAAVAAHPGVSGRLKADPDGSVWQYPGEECDEDCEPEIVSILEKEFSSLCQSLSTELMDPKANRFYEFRIYETEERKYLFMRFAHCITDAASISILINDIAAAYEGRELKCESMTIFDLGDELKEMTESLMYSITAKYYKGLFKDTEKWMHLPENRKEEELRLGTFEKKLDLSRKEIESFVKKGKTSPGNFFISLTGLVFARLSEADSAEFMMVYNGRNDSRLLNTFGFLATIFPISCRIGNASDIDQYMLDIQKEIIESMGQEVYPMKEMLERYPDMLNYTFVFQTADEAVTIGGQPIEINWLSENTGNALTKMVMQIIDSGEDYQLRIDYHENCYSKKWIETLADMLERSCSLALKGGTLKSLLEA